MKKRILSWLLIACMLLGLCPLWAAAAEEAGAEALGELQLKLLRSGAVAEREFELRLTDQSGALYRTTTLSAHEGETQCSVTMEDIPDGTYTLTITHPCYMTYEQELEFDGRCVGLTLYNYVTVNDGRTEADGLFGVFPTGDVNHDGIIDDDDAAAIVAVMDTENAAFDLDGSGVVDLADLSICVRNAGTVVLATPVHTVSSKVLTKRVTVEAEAGSTIKGSVDDLLDRQKEDTVVELIPAAADQPISEENPVVLSLPTHLDITAQEGSEEAAAQAAAAPVQAEAIYIAAPSGAQSTISGGTVAVEGVNMAGQNVKLDIPITKTPAAPVAFRLFAVNPEVTVENDGSIVVDLGERVAIKKVTIRVTATADQGNLAEIAKVEFLSDFAERIPEPQLSIPTVLSASNTESDGLGYKSLTVTWTPQTNVTGYEVSVIGPSYKKTAATTATSYTFQGDSFNGTVKSFETYQIKVRSVSGDWRSDWSEFYNYTVTCKKAPPAPEYLAAKPGVNSLEVSWTCKYDAETFTLYYKHPNDAAFTAVENLTASNYRLTGLEANAKYTLYVVAHNRNGSSPKSADAEGIPITPEGVQMPKYKLINVDAKDGTAAAHITSINGQWNKSYTIYKADGTTVDNSTATAEDWKALLDNDPNSYVKIPDWDSGVTYGNFRGPIIQLDDTYTMDTFRMSPFEGSNVHMNAVAIRYKTAEDTYETVRGSFYNRYDSQNRRYYEVVLPEPITTDYVEIRTSTSYGAATNYTICEVKLYEYDDLENTVNALFADNMHTELKETVTMDEIDALITRAENAIDPVSGEAHPHKTTIMADLEYAKALLEHNANAHVITVDNQITATGSPNGGFAQALSDYQPLGMVAAAGDTVVIYVSDGKTARGSNVNLKLVATQYHPQVTAWQSSAIQLKAGRNEITVPKIGADATERGGSLYLQYTGAKGDKNYTVRATGGAYIPVLNVDGITGAERTAAIETYVDELRDYAAQVETLHGQLHGADKDNTNVQYGYDAKNCFLNATEICLDNMMYSLPATQVWKAINAGGDPVGELEISLAAMEQMIDYFYQFKGLHRDATGADAYPYTRLNIRYHQMFTGAFMYAGGKHIGIEFGSTDAVFGLNPIVTDEDGKYVSGNLTGWGIAHEIGHCINHPSYQRVEVTNNVFAQLAKTGTGNEEATANFRTTYDNVYKAVATGTTGHTGNLAVQLGMYWQLHLAYDNSYAYKLYDSAEDAQAAVFYARLESYLRDKSKAPYPFTASGGDQLFMQAACAAAGKNMLHFFKTWGFTPDGDTVAYAAQYPAEARKIQYIDDDSRLYRLENKPGMSDGTAVTASITNAVERRINGNKVTISLGNTNTNDDAMLGYEICRDGKMVAFVPAGETSYTDVVTTENNKAFVYTVTGIDRLLNETETLALPQVKVCHDGAIDKSGWSVQTNMTSGKDTVVNKGEDDPESGVVNGNTTPGQEKVSAITAALDNDEDTVYYGAAGNTASTRPYILLDLGGVEQVTAVKFTPALKNYSGDASDGTGVAAGDLYKYRLFGYKVEISLDGSTWTTVKEGKTYKGGAAANPASWVKSDDIIFNGDFQGEGSYTLYFNKQMDDGTMDPFMYTYDAAYVRITSTTMTTMAVAEIDVLGPTSDNVELIEEGFGKLKEDFTTGAYADGTPCVIPAGAVAFYGSYKGDPSYNVVLLKDQNGKVLDGSQLIFAEVPAQGALGETSDGRWFYWLEDEEKTDDLGDTYNEFDQLDGLTAVQAELYRVRDAMTLAGQRLTSNSLTLTLPATIPDLTITSSATQSVAYAPTDAMLQEALAFAQASEEMSGRGASAVSLTAQGYYADTGAAETEEPAPVVVVAENGQMNCALVPESLAVAIQVDFAITPASDKISILPDPEEGVYQQLRYDEESGRANLYAVARKGTLDGIILTGTIVDLDPGTAVTAVRVYQIDAIHTTRELELNVSAQIPPEDDVQPDVSTLEEAIQAAQDILDALSEGDIVADGTTAADVAKGKVVYPASAVKALENAIAEAEEAMAAAQTEEDVTAALKALEDAVTLFKDAAITGTSGDTGSKPGTTPSSPTKPSGGSSSNKNQNTTTEPAETEEPTEEPDDTNNSLLDTAPETTAEKITDDEGNITVTVTDADDEVIAQVVIPAAAPALDYTFEDVADDDWFAEAVNTMAAMGVVKGMSATRHIFEPNFNITRGAMAQLLYNLSQGKAGMAENFSDVAADDWYADAVAWAAAAGVVNGYPNSTFAPNNDITREELAVMLYRYANLLGLDITAEGDLSAFVDGASVSSWATKAMTWAVANGLIQGKGANNLDPAASATRAETATMVQRFLGLVK